MLQTRDRGEAPLKGRFLEVGGPVCSPSECAMSYMTERRNTLREVSSTIGQRPEGWSTRGRQETVWLLLTPFDCPVALRSPVCRSDPAALCRYLHFLQIKEFLFSHHPTTTPTRPFTLTPPMPFNFLAALLGATATAQRTCRHG